MALNEVHRLHIGLDVIITDVDEDGNARDISAATTKDVILKSPQTNTVVTKTGTFTTDGTDGKFQYTTVEDDLDETGLWEVQGHVARSGLEYYLGTGKFKVKPNLDDE